ncbi:hypothetical protein CIW48_17825 [Methylobacterium sp. P1-11]|nr:hypothetical protein CIW48_17825 [Methylobacterium sp. P1-11]
MFSFRLRDRSKERNDLRAAAFRRFNAIVATACLQEGRKSRAPGAWMAEAFDAVAIELLNLGRT